MEAVQQKDTKGITFKALEQQGANHTDSGLPSTDDA